MQDKSEEIDLETGFLDIATEKERHDQLRRRKSGISDSHKKYELCNRIGGRCLSGAYLLWKKNGGCKVRISDADGGSAIYTGCVQAGEGFVCGHIFDGVFDLGCR